MVYSKNPHKRNCGLRTSRLKFDQYKNHFSLTNEAGSYSKIAKAQKTHRLLDLSGSIIH